MRVLQKKEQERAQRLMAMGQMAASLAHEIRNPLGSMELFCSLLKKDLQGQPQLLQVADQIHLGIKTLDRIISNCLQFSRDVTPRKKAVADVQALLEEARKYVQPKASDLGVKVEISHAGGAAKGDPHLLQQVLLNLLLNAVEAAGEKQGDALVTVTSSVDRGEWRIEVRDNGCGLTAEQQRDMFDPFFTTKEGGTGLGLAIVHSIIQAHEGSIEIESEYGRGTSAVIRLPQEDLEGVSGSVDTDSSRSIGTGG